jgi:hypothetical protein
MPAVEFWKGARSYCSGSSNALGVERTKERRNCPAKLRSPVRDSGFSGNSLMPIAVSLLQIGLANAN